MSPIKTITVFCGSRDGKKPSYLASATDLGKALVEQKINLVYGGGNTGLMGYVAKTAQEGGLKVTGVIPNVGWEVAVTYGDTINVETLAERKEIMMKMADAFIVLPGGFGTMNELMDAVDQYQCGLHNKPIGILNIDNYYDKLVEWIETSISEEFMYARGRDVIMSDSNPLNLINKLHAKSKETPTAFIEDGKVVV